MNRKGLAIIIAAVLLIGSLCFASADDTPETVREAAKSVFLVEDVDSYGTAFLIRKDTNSYFLTNNHVVRNNEDTVAIWLNDTEFCHAEVIAADPAYDLALLMVGFPVDSEPLPLADSVSRGDVVYTIGFPDVTDLVLRETARSNDHATMTKGIVGAVIDRPIESDGTPIQTLLFDAVINHGNSGGPLLNESGLVVGVNSWGWNTQNGNSSTMFGAPGIDAIRLFLAENNFSVEPEPRAFTPSVDVSFDPAGANDPVPMIWTYLAGAIGVLFAGAIVLILVSAHKKNKRIKALKKQPLKAYLASLSGKLSQSDIASLALPLATELKARRDAGNFAAYLPPQAILVTRKGFSIDPTFKPGKQANPLFAAPELFCTQAIGAEADVFAFSSLINYVQAYAEPADTDSPLAVLLEKGVSRRPEDRPDSMQVFIDALAAEKADTLSETALSPFPAGKAAKKAKRLVPVLIVSGATLALLAGLFFGNAALATKKLREAAETGSFYGIKFWRAQRIVGDEENEKSFSLSYGIYEYRAGRYANAYVWFDELGDYCGADEMAKESLYRLAEQELSRGDCDRAGDLFRQLGAYADAEDRVKECAYRSGLKLLASDDPQDNADARTLYLLFGDFRNADKMATFAYYRQGLNYLKQKSYDDAEAVFSELQSSGFIGAAFALRKTNYLIGVMLYEEAVKLYEENNSINAKFKQSFARFLQCEGFSDANSYRDHLIKVLFNEGVRAYRDGDDPEALSCFELLETANENREFVRWLAEHNYPEQAVQCYRTLIEIRKHPKNTPEDVEALVGMIDLPDARVLLMRDDGVLRFLDGTWNDNGATSVTITVNGSTVYFRMTVDGTDVSIQGHVELSENRVVVKTVNWQNNFEIEIKDINTFVLLDGEYRIDFIRIEN